MRENSIRQIWNRGHAAINGWLHIPSAWSAEVMAHQGYDSLTVDLEHGMAGFETALAMFQAISTTAVTPLARVPWNEPGVIMRLLDAGGMGIICPMVNTRSQAEAFVGACRYPPQGYRSFGPTRARLVAGSDYETQANQAVITLAMVETVEALNNVDAIAATPGLDGLYIGPGDLSMSLGGVQRVDLTEPRLVQALETILAAARRHGRIAGLHCNSPDYARRMIGMGFQFVTVMTDTMLLATMAQRTVAAVRAGDDRPPGGSASGY